MRRLLTVLICLTIVLSGFVLVGNDNNRIISEKNSELDNKNSEEHTENLNNKPSLEVLGEEYNFDLAVRTRSLKSVSDSDVMNSKLHSLSEERYDNTLNATEHFTIEESQGKTHSNAKKEYTVMIYIVGSDLESRLGAATMDIEEMRDVRLDDDKANLLLYTGGSRRWVSRIPNDKNCVIDMSVDDERRIIAQTNKSANMGLPETLSEFINYCTQNYPAEHYALILWNHGGGPLWGFGSDELFNYDSLNMGELSSAMEKTEFGSNNKLDWVGFDACLMGSLENAYIWKNYAQYLVSSEEVEAGTGWDYHFLNILNKSQKPENVVKSIIDSFEDYYVSHKTAFFNPDATLAVIDLNKVDALVKTVNNLFTVMNSDINNGRYAPVSKARGRTKEFGIGTIEYIDDSYDLIDLNDFAEQLEGLYPAESAEIKQAIDQTVLYSTSNVNRACGISIYIPENNLSLFEASGDLVGNSVPISDAYQSFVESYMDEHFNMVGEEWNLAELQEGDGEFLLPLKREQIQNLSQAYYTVFRKENSRYSLSLINIPIETDEHGMLHIPTNPMLVSVESDTYKSDYPWICQQVDRKDGVNTYCTWNTFLSSAGQFYDIDSDLDERVDILFKEIEGSINTEIQDVISESNVSWNCGKGSIDITDYTSLLDMGGQAYIPKRDKEGNITPFWNWITGENYTLEMIPVPFDNSFRFVMKPASDFECVFSCQVVIRDVHGGVHVTECRDFPKVSDANVIEEKTENGVIQYKIYENHAEMISYKGSDKAIVIPSSVSGKTVTVIADKAIYREEKNELKSVTLPDTIVEIGEYALTNLNDVVLFEGLKRIGSYAFSGYTGEEIEIPNSVEIIGAEAFSYSKLKRIKLPESLKKISTIPFRGCFELTDIQINESNPNYKTVNGVLYSADGKSLIEYPHGRGGSYVIENGTETIEFGAFAEQCHRTKKPIQNIVFPDTLKSIKTAAFFDCVGISEISFPDSLEEIGAMAFGSIFTHYGTETKIIEHIYIGKRIKRIGGKAFVGLKINGFSVDNENSFYSSVGGFITNKTKDTILIAPSGTDDSIIIVPDGITTIPSETFSDLGYGREYYIPDTVYRIAKEVFGSPEYMDFSDIKIHCSKGSAAETYAKKFSIPYDHRTDIYKYISLGDYEIVKETVDDTTLIWYVYTDHAELMEIDTRREYDVFEIPSMYNNLPVTAFGIHEDEALTHTYEGGAFIRKLVIPESIKMIRITELSLIQRLEHVEVSIDNDIYQSKDGVLFTSDGRILLYYPWNKKEEQYIIPDGTSEIREYAFSSCEYLKKVSFPDSVTDIGDGAFEGCSNLEEIEFGNGLQRVGSRIISETSITTFRLPSTVERIDAYGFEIRNGFGKIVLPDSLTYIGTNAFYTNGTTLLQNTMKIPIGLEFSADSLEGVLVKKFKVEEGNPYHSVKEGVLLSKDGKTLVAVPGQKKGRFDVPNGVKSIAYNAFKDCRFLTDVYLPMTVQDTQNIGINPDGQPSNYTVHCYEGSSAQLTLDEWGVEWVKIE